MLLTTKTQIIILAITFVLGAALGGLVHPSKEIKTTSNVKINTDVKSDRDTHEHTVTTITKTPDGTTSTRIDSNKDTLSAVDVDKRSESKSTSETVFGKRAVSISALFGASLHDPLIPVYGISISKPVISNLTVGAFGLTNGTLGVSVGWDF